MGCCQPECDSKQLSLCFQLAQGGTAVGTGLNTRKGYVSSALGGFLMNYVCHSRVNKLDYNFIVIISVQSYPEKLVSKWTSYCFIMIISVAINQSIVSLKVKPCQYLLFTSPTIWLLILQCESCRFDKKIAAQVAKETGMPFVTAPNKFEALVCLHWHLRVADYVGKLMFINAHLNGCFESNLIFTKVLHCFAGSPWCICGVQWCT